MCNPGNSESWNIQNPDTPKTPTYAGPPGRFKIECFAKIVIIKATIIFPKSSILSILSIVVGKL